MSCILYQGENTYYTNSDSTNCIILRIKKTPKDLQSECTDFQ